MIGCWTICLVHGPNIPVLVLRVRAGTVDHGGQARFNIIIGTR